jgi:glycosyltransferase involved in cell wall biosynthesis
MQPFLSIIVPVYKVEKYLRQCVNSILGQDFEDFELILVNDGSPDNSPNICDEYCLRDKRVKVIHKKNGGLVSARKAGVERANGKYIGFVDADDWISNEMYQKMCGVAIETNADIVHCNLNYVNNQSVVTHMLEINSGFYSGEDMIKDIYPNLIFNGYNLNNTLIPSLCTKIIKIDIIKNNLENVDDSITIGEDMACSYPCILDAESIYILAEDFLYFYRQNNESMVHSYMDNYFERNLLLVNLLQSINIKKNKYNIGSQIDKFAFYSASSAIKNEFLSDSPHSNVEKLRIVKKIMNDKSVMKSLKTSPPEMLDRQGKLFYYLLKNNWAILMYIINILYVYMLRNREEVKWIVKPFLRRFTKS